MKRAAELEALAAEFPVEDVKQRSGRGGMKLDYIPIETTINRLNEVLGADWDAELVSASLTPAYEENELEYLAVVTIQLKALGSTRCGVGASQGTDPDDAIKIAQAEAFKKASNLYGVGLYLWDAEKREEIATARAAAKKGRKMMPLEASFNVDDDAEEWDGSYPSGL